MTYRIFVDRFSSLDDLSKKDRHDYRKVKAAILKAGRFSAFEVDKDLASTITALCQDPTVIVDNSQTYPWTYVRAKPAP